ncbi:hypothetical protein PLICRDRAFT_38004 [Plicaturopsis crispa FD-325 SS-3]|nr:hypothetical protein PLICRDRAFT_38004 [Plicaturopsis crispa FD-325 SS-3]
MAPTTIPSIPKKRLLPSKEAALFKELLALYESRQLKKAQKTADQILKKFPEHGETICMKGLVLTNMGKRDEGFELVKKGVRLDLTSHICWHVFGLIQKAENNYEEALKSYTQALRFDKDNMNILRDTAYLQTQLRIFDGLVDTRNTIVKLRPQLRQNWVALAVAYHLNGDPLNAKKVLEAYERTLKDIPDYDVDHSETLIYHVRILEELGEFSEALDMLDISAKSRAIVDRVAIMEFRARLLSKLKRTDEAEHAWRALIEQNPDNYAYFRGYLSSKDVDLDAITDDNREIALTVLRDFSQSIPRAAAPKRLALTVATGDTFKELANPYLVAGLTKGVPSLFADVKALYGDVQKRQVIEDIVEGLRQSLVSEPSSSTLSSADPPTTYLWTLYFLAQHHSFLARQTRALEIISIALSHTPTLPELHTCKGRVLKRSGDLLGAARCLDDARLLDGQDRFLNTKCAKYRLRAGLVEEASDMFGLFTKKDAASPGADLEEMQSLLYLTEEGDAHHRNGNLHLALKKYSIVQKLFDEFEDDQYDFHAYCMRKFTLSTYIHLITWEDHLRSHPAYVSAALNAARIWVAIHDNPSLAKGASGPGLTDAEKKAKKKAKKAAQKSQTEQKKAVAAAAANDEKAEVTPPKDDDPDGMKLLLVSDGLERAAKILSPLATLASQNIEVWIVSFDVALRRHKLAQAAKAINFAHSLDAQHPDLHLRTVELRKTVGALSEPLSETIRPVVADALSKTLPEDVSPDTFNSQYLQRHSNLSSPVLASAKASRLLGAPLDEVESTVFTTLGPDTDLDIKTALASLAFLDAIGSPRVDEYRASCDARFELSTVFKTRAELDALRKDILSGGEKDDADKAEVLN